METLRQFSPEIEIYSIDESFLKFTDPQDLLEIGQTVRSTVRKWTGVPVSVGFWPTKALAKLANRLSKKSAGVMDLTTRQQQDEARAATDVSDALDKINDRFGARTMRFGAEGIDPEGLPSSRRNPHDTRHGGMSWSRPAKRSLVL